MNIQVGPWIINWANVANCDVAEPASLIFRMSDGFCLQQNYSYEGLHWRDAAIAMRQEIWVALGEGHRVLDLNAKFRAFDKAWQASQREEEECEPSTTAPLVERLDTGA